MSDLRLFVRRIDYGGDDDGGGPLRSNPLKPWPLMDSERLQPLLPFGGSWLNSL